MKVEYNGYTLEIEEVEDNEVDIKYYTANCAELPYFPSGIFKTNLAFIIEDFKRTVHAYTFNQLNKNKEEEKKVDTSITSINEGVAYQVKIKDKEYIIDVINNKLYRVV